MDFTNPGVPSAITWRDITHALDAEREPARLQAALEAVDDACAGWPESLRLAPGRWVRAVFTGLPEPRLRVARGIDIVLLDLDAPGDRLAWCDAPALAHFSVVRILDARLGDAGLARWLDGASHLGVRDLALGSGISDRGAARLASDARLRGLSSLALFRNRIGAEGVAALMASPHLGRGLQRLLLGRNPLGLEGARALAAGGSGLSGLLKLDLDAGTLDGDAIEALVDAPFLESVRWLNLSNNRIGRRGCEALASCMRFGRLEQLFLHGCDIDDEAARPLLAASWLGALSNLALSGNRLSMRTVSRIAQRTDLNLDELDICHNEFAEEQAVEVLAGAPQLAGLRRLCA